jgi:phosphoesterase RecJ-like protein
MEHQAAKLISSAKRVLLICHVSPDGDAIGSLLGLGLALRRRNQDVVMACADPVPDVLCYLPHCRDIVESPDGAFDLVISLDCSDLQRLGAAYDRQRLAGIPIANIDHHQTNVEFGQLNWVESDAAATAQLLVRLIAALDVPLDFEIATCLLNGIVTDTRGFRTSNTTPQVMRTVSKLMEAGASLPELTDRIFNHRPMGTIRLWSLALPRMHLDRRILWGEITQDMRREADYQGDGDAGLVNFMSTADEADIAVVFDELDDGRVNVSMRAMPGYDVSQVALELGGGGHAQAAGCTLPGPVEEARMRVLERLQTAWTQGQSG